MHRNEIKYGRGNEVISQCDMVFNSYDKRDQLVIHSLDFEEFLWANGYSEETISYLKSFYDNKETVPDDIHQKYEELVREYIVVGGMPEVVADFAVNNDFNHVQEIQNRLISDYEDDIAQHAKGVEKTKARKCYDSIRNWLF